MDFIIVYERKQRELDNSILLKIELEKRGHECAVYQYYEADKFTKRSSLKSTPKVVLVPYLYNTKNISRTFSRFGRADKIVNLQYEQVLSKKWEDLGHHNPKNEAKKGVHICWGEKTKERLLKAKLAFQNIEVLGAIQCDMLRPEYRENKKNLKKRISEHFNIDQNKKWNVFLSSFTYADISEERLSMNEKVADTSLKDFKKIHTESRDELISWFDKILLKIPNELFIYRPHPDELYLEKVEDLKKKYKNFLVIRDFAVKEWIITADKLYTWYSTSVVEAHFLDIPYSILRPKKLPETFDSVLLKYGYFITTYSDFEKDFFKKEELREKSIPDKYINYYYNVDINRASFKKYADYLEKILKDEPQKFEISKSLEIRCEIISNILKIIYKIFLYYRKKYGLSNKSNNFFMKWFVEWDNQIASEEEKEKIEEKFKKILLKSN